MGKSIFILRSFGRAGRRGPGGLARGLDQTRMVAELERDPERVPAYYGELESAIRWLMDTTYLESDADNTLCDR